jgi:hypothetical protein
MAETSSLLEQLRVEYEASRQSPHQAEDVEGFEQLDARLRKTFRWLENAVTYLDGLKPPIAHRFDVGHGLAFESPRFNRGSVGQHTRRIVGYPVLDEINIYYEIAAAKGLSIDVAPGAMALAQKALDQAGLQYTNRCTEGNDGVVRRCTIDVPPAIPASVSFHADYQTGLATVALVNVDRLDRVTLEFHSTAIDEPMLEDLVRFILGRANGFLHRAPLAGIRGSPSR